MKMKHFIRLLLLSMVAVLATPSFGMLKKRLSSRNRISSAFGQAAPAHTHLVMNDTVPEPIAQPEIEAPTIEPETLESDPTQELQDSIIEAPIAKDEIEFIDELADEPEFDDSTAQDSIEPGTIKEDATPIIEPQEQTPIEQEEIISSAQIIEPENNNIDDQDINAIPQDGETLSEILDDAPFTFHEKEKSLDDQDKQALEELQEEPEELIEFHFENADLKNLIEYIEQLFDLTFILDESVEPLKKDAKTVKGNKLSFKTNEPLTREQAWNLFTTFLEIAGFTVVPTGDPAFYRIESLKLAKRSAIRAFIGVEPEQLPHNDEIIRYVYFVKNSALESIIPIIDSLRSSDAPLLQLKSHKAFIITDKAYNIKTLMDIVKELDQVSMPQSMSVLKLRQADAQEVKKLYASLLGPQQPQKRTFGPRKKETSSMYFPEDTRIIAEPRTNSLILLGAKDSIRKIEEFILKYVDIDLDQPYSPLHVHQLKYADAETVADIMREVTQFGQNTPAGIAGGVRGKDKYLKPMSFTPEKATNRLIIKGDYEDYLRAKEVIEQLDEAQPQVAIEILILDVTNSDAKEAGAQIRNKIPGANSLLGNNVQFQTSGLRAGGQPNGIVEKGDANVGVQRLLGNLLELVTGAGPGNTILSLGRDACGVWGIFQLLETVTNAQIVSNPFLMATNKTKARVSLGETRRVITGTIVGQNDVNSRSDEPAALTVEITPQINSDGMISLDFTIDITEFTNPADPNSADKNVKKIVSKTIVADQEVLALGGLVRNKMSNNLSKTPVLGSIPVLGWLFKNKRKSRDKENLLILVSTRIVRPDKTEKGNIFTSERTAGYRNTLNQMRDKAEERDPIHKLFFAENQISDNAVDDLIFERHGNKKAKENRRKKRAERRKRRQERKLARAKRRRNKKEKELLKIEQIADDQPLLVHNVHTAKSKREARA